MLKRERRGSWKGEEWVGRVTVARQPILGSDSYSTPSCTTSLHKQSFPFSLWRKQHSWELTAAGATAQTHICNLCAHVLAWSHVCRHQRATEAHGALFWPHPCSGIWLQSASSERHSASHVTSGASALVEGRGAAGAPYSATGCARSANLLIPGKRQYSVSYQLHCSQTGSPSHVCSLARPEERENAGNSLHSWQEEIITLWAWGWNSAKPGVVIRSAFFWGGGVLSFRRSQKVKAQCGHFNIQLEVNIGRNVRTR